MPPSTRGVIRRIALDVPRKELARFEIVPGLDAVESFRVVHQFRFDRSRFAGICEITFRSTRLSPVDLVGLAGFTRVQTLSRRDGAFLAYFEGRPESGWARLVASVGAHIYPPFELTPDAWRICVIGTPVQLHRFLAKLRSLHIDHRIRTLGKAEFRDVSPLALLTRCQREALTSAYRLGYYGVPRRVESSEVARSLGLSKSTTVEHLRKAEKRLLDGLFSP